MSRRLWSAIEDGVLRELWPTTTPLETIGEQLGRSAGSVKARASAIYLIGRIVPKVKRPGGGGWTQERLDRLEKMWADGKTAEGIGATMGKTRSAILGMIHRLGISRDPAMSVSNRGAGARAATKARTQERRPRPAMPSAPRKIATSPIYRGDLTDSPVTKKLAVVEANTEARGMAEPQTVQPGAIACIDLEPRHCKWPIGDPQSGPFGFCGKRRPGSGPYCEPHTELATGYRPGRRDDISRLARLAR